LVSCSVELNTSAPVTNSRIAVHELVDAARQAGAQPLTPAQFLWAIG